MSVARDEKLEPWKYVGVAATTTKSILDQLGINSENRDENCRLLDFGCGAGRYMKAFTQVLQPSNIYGTDVDSSRFSVLREIGFTCKALDVKNVKIDFDDNFFDYIFSSNVIEHIEKSTYKKYLNELFRILKPGGVFAVGAPNYPMKRLFDIRTAWVNRHNPDLFRYYLFDDPTHVNFVNVIRVEKDLKRVGFTEIELSATELPFQQQIKYFRSKHRRKRFRILGNKFFGSCQKPVVSSK